MSVELGLTRPPYLGQVFLVVDHAVDQKVRLRLSEAEECFSSLISAEVKSTNVEASAPPDVPRLTLADNHKNLSLAQSRMQFALSFDHGFDVDKAFEIIKKNASAFLLAAGKFQALDQHTQLGFIVHANQPCEEPKEILSQYLAEKLYAGKILGDIASFDLRLGFKTKNNLYKNFGFNVYELRELKLPLVQPGQGTTIKIEDVPMKEMGISNVLDINNKPRLPKSSENSSEISFEQTAQDIIDEMHLMLMNERHQILPLKATNLLDK